MSQLKFRVRDHIRMSHKRKYGNGPNDSRILTPAQRQRKANAIRANRRHHPDWPGCDCWE